jgi:hypothetical protein
MVAEGGRAQDPLNARVAVGLVRALVAAGDRAAPCSRRGLRGADGALLQATPAPATPRIGPRLNLAIAAGVLLATGFAAGIGTFRPATAQLSAGRFVVEPRQERFQ